MHSHHLRLLLAMLWVGSAASASAQTPLRVTIDVKPGDSPTTIEVDRGGMLPLALLSTPQFDALSADPSTLRVGPKGTEAEPFRTMAEDVNDDGRLDLLILVRLQTLGLTCSDKMLRLTGQTKAGAEFEGSEAITVTGCPAG